MSTHDEDGQPPKALYYARVNDRLVAELLGLCKGMVCDGVVSEGEATSLRRWLGAHPDAAVGYPGQVLAERLQRVFADGVVAPDEQQELSELLLDLTGETASHDAPLNQTARAFFDEPLPTVLFDGMEYVFTGRMLYGTRAEVEQAVSDRGGRCVKMPTRSTDYVVVGPIASAAWIQSTHGTKLLRAAELRASGIALRIIPEEHWILALTA